MRHLNINSINRLKDIDGLLQQPVLPFFIFYPLLKQNNMKQQTAVEWLLQELDKVNHPTEAMIMYAKKLEKEQSKKDYKSGVIDGFNSRTLPIETNSEQYYNETYNNQHD